MTNIMETNAYTKQVNASRSVFKFSGEENLTVAMCGLYLKRRNYSKCGKILRENGMCSAVGMLCLAFAEDKGAKMLSKKRPSPSTS